MIQSGNKSSKRLKCKLNILNIELGRMDDYIAFVLRNKYDLSGDMNNG